MNNAKSTAESKQRKLDRIPKIVALREAGFTFQEIGEELGCAAATAFQGWHAHLRKLKEKP